MKRRNCRSVPKTDNQVEPARQTPQVYLKRDDVSEDDDEEIPEEEAFNADDERKYGGFFQKSDAGEEVEEDTDDKSDDEDDDGVEEEGKGDGGQYMLDLLNRLDSNQRKSTCNTSEEVVARHVPESQYAASVVPTSQLTLDALVQGLKSTSGFFGKDGLQTAMKGLLTSGSGTKTTTAPLSTIATDRMKRKLRYEQEQKSLSMWIDAVQEHRTAETLDFTPKERLANLTREKMIDKFEPTTDFEKELFAAIQQQQESSVNVFLENPDDDDLGAHQFTQFTLEEYKHRRANLAKMRALLFYHEVKRHHINKIKSKTYRRIRKKQRQRQKEGEVDHDPDLAKELREKEELERLKERMTLAHKNTSRWAKHVLKRGKNADLTTRRALSAQLQRGNNLRKKMAGVRDQADDGDDDPRSLIESAREILADTENSNPEGQGIFKLSFMQRGIEKQRDSAREEARQLLLELKTNFDAEQEESEVFNVHVDNRAEADISGKSFFFKRLKKRESSEKEMQDVVVDGNLVTSSLAHGKASSRISMAENIEIDVGSSVIVSEAELSKCTIFASKGEKVTASTKMRNSIASDEPDLPSTGTWNKQNQTLGFQTNLDSTTSEEDLNPWFTAAHAHSNLASKPQHSVARTNFVNVDDAASLAFVETDKESNRNKDFAFKDAHDKNVFATPEKKIASLTQEELVQRAFYSASHKATEEEFSKEKQAMTERDDPYNKQRTADAKPVAGWGCWTGVGAPALKPSMTPTSKHLQLLGRKQLLKRKRQDDKMAIVIINEKRVKKTADQFQIANIPFPYTSRAEYERSMAGAVGHEWNLTSGFKNLTRPEILTRSGKIIQPVSKRAKKFRPAAKF